MARLLSVLLFFLAVLNLGVTKEIPEVDYDVIIVGGGPAGLSALSSLCRVSRRAILIDSAEYRNNKTRNMHDVIGADGLPPADFRAAARAQIDKYHLATIKTGTKVTDIEFSDHDGFRVFRATDSNGATYTARRLILATGVTDVLPETPGVWDAYGKGMYWCPWCDGFEHRDQSLGVIGPLGDALSSVLEMHNINPDTIVLTNGSDTPEQRKIATERSPTWEQQLAAYNVPIINNTIESIERLRDGGHACAEPPPMSVQDNGRQQVIPIEENAGPNGKHYDLFRVHFTSGLTLERAAFLVNIPVKQTSTLPVQLGLKMEDPKVVVSSRTMTSIDGLFAIGDMNNEGSTNVPHAMYNGKKAAVVIHVQLAKEESMASISKRSLSIINDLHLERITMEKIGDELEKIWDNIKAQYAS